MEVFINRKILEITCLIGSKIYKIYHLGARSFYVIDTDKKQLIEVEANSKDDLEK